jgi:hypothetical protein
VVKKRRDLPDLDDVVGNQYQDRESGVSLSEIVSLVVVQCSSNAATTTTTARFEDLSSFP